jgi:hypothetical protein
MVFWRDMGWNEEEDAVEAREGVCSMTDMLAGDGAAMGDGLPGPKPLERSGDVFGTCDGGANEFL